jgi:RimJ/RimL family protein N-acetyltransferase
MIYGKRIRFRAPERSDIPRFVTWLNDPEVRRGISQYLPYSTIDEEKWFDKMLSWPQYEKAGFIHEGRLRQAEFQQGKFLDILIMGILCSDFMSDKRD